MPDPTRAADLLARRLAEAGCTHAFGMPGGEVLILADALKRAGIELVLARHENAGGFMAEGVHHRTGAPAVVLATLGPGALNVVNVTANALQDRVPMIVLTGCVDADEAESYSHQVLDQQAVFRPVVKESFRLTGPSADLIADKAVRIATGPRPGPVHIDVPIGVAGEMVTARRRRTAAETAGVPGAEWLAEARERLAAAERPAIVAGLDCLAPGGAEALRAVAEAAGTPVVTSYKAKGVLAEDHPLALGGAGLSPKADAVILPFLRGADVVLLAGYDPIEMRAGWREPWDAAAACVIDVAAAPNDQRMHDATMAFAGDVPGALAALAEGIDGDARWPGGEPGAVREALALAFPADGEWGPAAVIDECRKVLPPETVASVDSGAHRILLSQMWTCPEPRSLLQSTGLCTMGCALPLAMGSRMAAPERPHVALMGDAGFLMVAGELSVAAELGLPVIVVVFVDASLALIEKKQREGQMANLWVDFERHDMARIGQAFGGYGARVKSRDELRAALEAALVAPRFTVIAAEIERGAYDGAI